MEVWGLITLLGDKKAYLFLVPLVYFLANRRLGWRVLLLAVFSAACVHALKDIFRLPRPPQELWRVSASGYAFPSGHATAASAFWSYLSLKMKKPWLCALAAVLIILISLSRVILGVHYLRDVAGGVCIGVLISLLFFYLDEKIQGMKESRKGKSLAAGTVFALLISPYIILKLPSEGALFLGFVFAHIAVHFLGFKEVAKLGKKLLSFALCMALMLAGYLLQNPLLLPLFGFLACFTPQALWNFVDKRAEKQR